MIGKSANAGPDVPDRHQNETCPGQWRAGDLLITSSPVIGGGVSVFALTEGS
jgi:hypothetical protein